MNTCMIRGNVLNHCLKMMEAHQHHISGEGQAGIRDEC